MSAIQTEPTTRAEVIEENVRKIIGTITDDYRDKDAAANAEDEETCVTIPLILPPDNPQGPDDFTPFLVVYCDMAGDRIDTIYLTGEELETPARFQAVVSTPARPIRHDCQDCEVPPGTCEGTRKAFAWCGQIEWTRQIAEAKLRGCNVAEDEVVDMPYTAAELLAVRSAQKRLGR